MIDDLALGIAHGLMLLAAFLRLMAYRGLTTMGADFHADRRGQARFRPPHWPRIQAATA